MTAAGAMCFTAATERPDVGRLEQGETAARAMHPTSQKRSLIVANWPIVCHKPNLRRPAD